MAKDDTNSHWRRTSRSAIAKVIASRPELQTKDMLPTLFKLVSKAYPFGERRMYPYKCFLKEVGLARRLLERDLGVVERNPYYVKCGSCGARPGFDCKPIGSLQDDFMVAMDAELEGRMEDAEKIRKGAFHEARLIAVGLALPNDTLPLFAEST